MDRARPGAGRGARLLEGAVGGLPFEEVLADRRELRVGAAVPPGVGTDGLPEHLVADLEVGHAWTGSLDDPGQIGPRDRPLRFQKSGAHQAQDAWLAPQHVPDVRVEG